MNPVGPSDERAESAVAVGDADTDNDTDEVIQYPVEPLASWALTGQLREDGAVRTVRIAENPFTVGRHSDNSLCIANPTVSSRHAELLAAGDGLFVRDLGSTNGTYVNGHRLSYAEPLADGDLVQFGTSVFRLARHVTSLTTDTQSRDVQDEALALFQFSKLMADRAVNPHFQPVVEIRTSRIIGYEVLGRSRLVGLQSAVAMFRAASQLNAEVALSRLMRDEGLREAICFPPEINIFFNTHPSEISDPGLLNSLKLLRKRWPERPITLEVHEAAVTDSARLREIRAALKDLEIMLAYDDFGAGQARLLELAEVRPDFLKFDIGMIQNIDSGTAERQQMLETLVQMVLDLDIAPLAEGVETQREFEVCRNIGFELGQGYFFGKPASAGQWSKRQG